MLKGGLYGGVLIKNLQLFCNEAKNKNNR